MNDLRRLMSQVARLESQVDFIKRDVADIKIDMRRMDDWIRRAQIDGCRRA